MTGPLARVRSPQPESSAEGASSLTIRIGPQELVIRRRYEAGSIVNDVLIGLWFLIGSVFFFFDSLTRAGTVLFVIGSVEMLIRPVVRLARHLHLQRLHRGSAGVGAADF
nr:YrhK family protein [uncultured Actinomyces sp.]